MRFHAARSLGSVTSDSPPWPEHARALDPLAAVELEHDPLTGPLGADRLRAGTNLDPEITECRRELLADERLLARVADRLRSESDTVARRAQLTVR